jgi:hypothetical protein
MAAAMKVACFSASVALLLALSASGQGTFIYDQQSATEGSGGGVTTIIQDYQPMGQSFVPSLGSIGFVRLDVSDSRLGFGGATLYVNLRADSITGQVLGATDSIDFTDGFHGYVNFFFPIPVALTPGQTYYFQPVVQSGDFWSVTRYNNYFYPNGAVYLNGVADVNGFDLWFREGIVVPEPSAVALFVSGGSGLLWLGRRKWRPR